VLVLFTCGAGWLMAAAHISAREALTMAVLPFLPGEALKVAVAAGLYGASRRSPRA
jgi:biotin transport system substrate-specific component